MNFSRPGLIACLALINFALSARGGVAPSIISGPVGRVAPAGTNIAFSVTADGTALLLYQWYFNSNAIPDETNATLLLTNVQSANAGPYFVTVSNDFGATNSGVANLVVNNAAPIFWSQPQGMSTWPGSAALLSAGYVGSTPLTLQWRLNGVDLPGATNAALALPNVQFSDGGSYVLLASNAYGTRLTTPAPLNVAELAAWGAGAASVVTLTNYGQSFPPNGLSNLLAVAAGGWHSLALLPNGRVAAWGYNNVGQINNFIPATNVAAIAAGWEHNLVLRSNGTLAAWGYTAYGLTQITAAMTNVAAIAAGWLHNVAVRSNTTVFAWGLNAYGQTNVPPGLSNVVAVAAGYGHSLALKADGQVVAWGLNTSGQTNVPADLSDVVAIAAGASNSLALTVDGTVVAWGANDYGQSTVPAGLSNVIAIAAGGAHALALQNDGMLVTWGLDNYQQATVPASLPTVAGIAAGQFHSLALLTDNSPHFVRRPLDHLGYENNPAYLNAAACGLAPLHYQWLRGVTAVEGATNATLSLGSAQLGDTGTYQLVVTNDLGAITSTPVALTILSSRPYFVIQPTNYVTLAGTNATFSALATSPWGSSYQWQFNGADLPNETNATLTLVNVQLVNEGSYSVVASNLNGSITSSNAYLDVLTLPEALNATNLTWNTFGDVLWKPAFSPAYANPGVGLCGPLTPTQQGFLQTTVVGPGTLSFAWQAPAYTSLNFELDGLQQGFVQMSSTWQPRTYYLSAGSHVLTWIASLSFTPFGSGYGYLDAVTFTPGATPVTLTAQPASKTLPAGTNAIFSVGAAGTPPLSYQWSFNGTNLPGATGASLALHDIQAGATGTYRVTVSNDYGGQSSTNFSLVVTSAAPVLLTQPIAQQMLVGGAVLFSGTAQGTQPITYQWRRNGVDLPGATNTLLMLADVQLTDAADYSLSASNVIAETVSSNACLFVYELPDLVSALGGTGITWSTDTNAPWFPQTNVTHDGVLAGQSGALATNSQSSVLTGVVNGPATVTFWWKVSCDSFWSGLSFLVNGVGQATIAGDVDWQPQSFLIGPGPQTLQWNLTRGTFGSATDRGWVDEVEITPGWVPVALTAQPSNFTAMAGNAVTFGVAATGTPPLRYQWQFEGASLANATNATLTLVNVQSNNIGNYSVVVSNDYSGATSTNALLSVSSSGPVLTAQPADRLTTFNNTTTFSVGVKGSNPLRYQWLFNSNAIADATNASLVLTGLQPANVGDYRVVVSNEFGSVTTSNAHLNLARMVVLDFLPTPLNTRPTPADLTNLIAIAAGTGHSLALRDDGTVTAWGNNTFGQTNIPTGLADVVAIAAGSSHNVALKADGTVVAWGDNTYGQTMVPPGLSGVRAIAGASSYNLALKDDGTVVGWGQNNYGQLNIPPGLSNVVAIAAGNFNGAAVKLDGKVVVWGQNTYGQGVPQAGISNVVGVALSGSRGWGLFQDASVSGWGFAAFNNWENIAALSATGNDPSTDYVVLLTYDGTIIQSSTFHYNLPAITGSLQNAVAIAASPNQALVVLNDGTPFLASRLHDRAVLSGATTVFASGVVGAKPLFHQWQFNQGNIPGATNNLLILTNTPLTASGDYRCVVSNALGSLTTPPAHLTVIRSTPRIASASSGFTTNGAFALSLSGLSGHGNIILFTSTNLADWQPILTNPPVLGSLLLADPSTTNVPVKFYRIEEE